MTGDFVDLTLVLVKDFLAVVVLADLDEIAMVIIIRVISLLSRTEKDLESFIHSQLGCITIETGQCCNAARWEQLLLNR